MTHTVVAASNHYKVGAPLGGPLFLCPGLESNGHTVRFLPWTLGVWYAWYKSGRSRQKVSYTMSTQMHLLDEAIRWVAKATAVPYENLIDHMIVIGDVARTLDKFGKNYGEPYATDYHFENYNWDDVFEMVLSIWGE
jgi:hypothetical protein